MPLDDAALCAAARDGDLDAFGELVHRFERRVRSVLARILDDERDVEEAAQDVFVQVWRNLHSFRGDAAVSTWLYRIAVNVALQRRRRVAPVTVELVEVTAAPEPDGELRRALLTAIRALPPEQRTPLVLRDLEGLSNQEVAEVLGLTVEAAKSRIHRARMQVRAALEEAGL